ncbi:MAG: metallophosphoesterase [Alphaproteobacteria bacterium MedPE-SWcel]|nr:MAG: metallophosphoesterase [Alphaproteobacteria bacterium MedPE-SWcel]
MRQPGLTSGFEFTLSGTELCALGAGALWWAKQKTLVVSDLHLGKSERLSRRNGLSLPPYETRDTLDRLHALITDLRPRCVICLGDTFDDDLAARNLPATDKSCLQEMMHGLRWIWIQGNHDPAPPFVGGEAMAVFHAPPLTFRHIALPEAIGEVSGHYHPKASLRGQYRPAFLLDRNRLILPAFGTYTGGLRCTDPVLATLMEQDALAILTGATPLRRPMHR